MWIILPVAAAVAGVAIAVPSSMAGNASNASNASTEHAEGSRAPRVESPAAAPSSGLPLLKANPDGGSIVNTASVAALVAAPGTSAYAASKAAVVAVSEVLAAELGDDGNIGISILLPGLVRTNINANAVNRPGHREDGPRTEDFLPQHTVLEPGEVGAMVVDAIRSGRRYVFTHPETQKWVTGRSDAIAAAFSE
jgi:short-subunit dehydrogenase